jgi:hypothetical protein
VSRIAQASRFVLLTPLARRVAYAEGGTGARVCCF